MIPSPVRRGMDWWHAQTGPDRYRLYTRLTLQSVLIGVIVVVIVSGTRPWPVAGVVIAGLAGIAGLEAQRVLSVRADARQRRALSRFAVLGLAAVWLVSVLVRRTAEGGVARDAGFTASFAVFMAAASVLSFTRHRWLVLTAICAATALAIHQPAQPWLGVVVFAVSASLMWTTRFTVWGLQVVTDLEQSKDMAAELTLAQERLRFSRDLHDVVGRAFSAVAVKSELAATLARAGDTDRAAAEMDEVHSLAVSSMEEARTLVRGYRDIDLATEVAGARSLLSAAACRLRVIGLPEEVPRSFHEVAAWVVREGTTNIVKHSTATEAVLTLGPGGLTLRNDGVPRSGDGAPAAGHGPAPAPRIASAAGAPKHLGLRGLGERLHAVGAELGSERSGEDWILSVTWEAA